MRGLVGAALGAAVIPALAYAEEPATRAIPLTLDHAARTSFLIHRDSDTNPLLNTVIRIFRQAARSLSSDIMRIA